MQTLAQIEPFVYEWTSAHRGSISAEHGLGLMKANKIFYSKPTATVSQSVIWFKRMYIWFVDMSKPKICLDRSNWWLQSRKCWTRKGYSIRIKFFRTRLILTAEVRNFTCEYYFRSLMFTLMTYYMRNIFWNIGFDIHKISCK